jgi:hypothetical protein
VQLIFSVSTHWKEYDVFKQQKDSALFKSKWAIEEMADRFCQGILEAQGSLANLLGEPAKLLFTEMTELALWGNATDLSLLTNLSLTDIQKLQGKRAAEENQRNIVDNDLIAVWEDLAQGQRTGADRRIDFILDNAGFELFTDLVYAAYLIEADLASSIVFHVKCFPWFVSDALHSDFDTLLNYLESSEVFTNGQSQAKLASLLRDFLKSGVMKIESHPFWTTAYSFHELPKQAPELLERLQHSYLTVWKGDLNYRKLTIDGLWPHTTTFKTALGPLGAGSGVKLLALRTNKSDTCVGIESEVKVKELDSEAPGKAWVKNGKYAVISFSDGM